MTDPKENLLAYIQEQVEEHKRNINTKREELENPDPTVKKKRVKKLQPTTAYWNPNRDMNIPMKDFTEEYGKYLSKNLREKD